MPRRPDRYYHGYSDHAIVIYSHLLLLREKNLARKRVYACVSYEDLRALLFIYELLMPSYRTNAFRGFR